MVVSEEKEFTLNPNADQNRYKQSGVTPKESDHQLSDGQKFLRYSDTAARYQMIFSVAYDIRNCKKTGLQASVEIQMFRRAYTLMASHFTGHVHQDNSN